MDGTNPSPALGAVALGYSVSNPLLDFARHPENSKPMPHPFGKSTIGFEPINVSWRISNNFFDLTFGE